MRVDVVDRDACAFDAIELSRELAAEVLRVDPTDRGPRKERAP